MRIHALRDNVDSIVDKYNWTGNGSIKLSSMVPEHKIIELGTRNIWQLYQINLGRSLRKGTAIEVAVRWDLEDISHVARPFISQTIETATGSLKLRLEVPEDFGVTRAQKTILPTIDSLASIYDEPLDVRNGVVEWTVTKPKLLHCYQLAWFDPGADATPPNRADLALPMQKNDKEGSK